MCAGPAGLGLFLSFPFLFSFLEHPCVGGAIFLAIWYHKKLLYLLGKT